MVYGETFSEKFQVLCKNPDEVTRFDGIFLSVIEEGLPVSIFSVSDRCFRAKKLVLEFFNNFLK
jgi:hypothetical protein